MCPKEVWLHRIRLVHDILELKTFVKYLGIFVRGFEVLKLPALNAYQTAFLRKTASVELAVF